MTSQVDRANATFLARQKSNDFNDAQRLSSRAVVNAISAYASGGAYLPDGLGVGGVFGGFLVRAVSGTNNIEVSQGIGIVAAVPDDSLLDPPAIWLELKAPTQFDLTAQIDGVNPRLIMIELQPAEVAKRTEIRAIFNDQIGTFDKFENVDTVVGSEPVIVANAGVAAPAPVVPTGSNGNLPIAVVKLTAAQASFDDDYASVLMCRPLLEALGDRGPLRVQGGGLSVGEVLGGSIVAKSAVDVSACVCRLLGIEAELRGRVDYNLRARTPNDTTAPALVSAIRPIYAYAVPPPWDSAAYGALAPREAWQRNPNGIANTIAGNVVNGDGATFKSLMATTNESPWRTFKNAIVVFDLEAPLGLEKGAGLAPQRVFDPAGPHPDTGGMVPLMVLLASQDPTWGATQEVTDSVYLGSVACLNTGDFMAQADIGHGKVEAIDLLDLGALTGRRPVFRQVNTQAITDVFPGIYPAMVGGGTPIIPTGATSVEIGVQSSMGSGAGSPVIAVGEAVGYGATDATFLGKYRVAIGLAVDNPSVTTTDFVTLMLSTAGAIRYQTIASAANFSMTLWLRGYTDAFIAAR